ncbi:Fic family protein [Myxococcota bacterium]|jgi:Fic family protein|nr:Fic family protein [Myxococcota bacterium]MBP8971574.1 Fic family protein [Myxococcota bacterium]OQC38463.1 MAG: Adenosine monophosphate-protein transferase SoFic [Deltaproteobacteria bacterium ADurb.Bin058]
MMTINRLANQPLMIPQTAVWYLTDLAEFKGRQEMFARQAPQRLQALREHAIVESTVSSNRIEGINIDGDRVATLVFGRPSLRDRDEEEVRGYRNALNLIHQKGPALKLDENAVLNLHRLVRGEIWDAGKYKEQDSNIIQRYPDGRERIRFRTVAAAKTADAMSELLGHWHACIKERHVHPLIAMVVFNLDFLCIHPFRDGNGRVSRLLMLLMCYHLGYEVGRFISLERLIEENKERYYETLEASSQGWHEGTNDPWPYVYFLLYLLKTAYKEFEKRVGETALPRGAKTEMVQHMIESFTGEFTLGELQRACPLVSQEMVRLVLKEMKAAGQVECLGRGPGARWKRKDRPQN